MLKENEVYVIQFDYSTEDCDGVDVFVFKEFEKAKEKFKSMIESEKTFFKTNYSHKEEDDFELDTNIDDDSAEEYFWNYKCNHDYYIHTFLDLRIKELN